MVSTRRGVPLSPDSVAKCQKIIDGVMESVHSGQEYVGKYEVQCHDKSGLESLCSGVAAGLVLPDIMSFRIELFSSRVKLDSPSLYSVFNFDMLWDFVSVLTECISDETGVKIRLFKNDDFTCGCTVLDDMYALGHKYMTFDVGMKHLFETQDVMKYSNFEMASVLIGVCHGLHHVRQAVLLCSDTEYDESMKAIAVERLAMVGNPAMYFSLYFKMAREIEAMMNSVQTASEFMTMMFDKSVSDRLILDYMNSCAR